jgi:hypothetical protein
MGVLAHRYLPNCARCHNLKKGARTRLREAHTAMDVELDCINPIRTAIIRTHCCPVKLQGGGRKY